MWLEQLARAVRLITGSPADATIGARCSGGPPPIQPGDFCTYTQGGWGAACAGNNPGCIRDTNFSVVFQNGLFIGQGVTWTGASPNNGTNGTLDGVEPWAAKWTSSSAIENYLPAGGAAGRLTADLVNPTSTSSRVLDGQLVAATLNAAFNRAGVLVGNDTSTKLADLKFQACALGVPASVQGKTVAQVLDLAEIAVSRDTPPLPLDELNAALDAFNRNFDNCTDNLGCLTK